MYVNTDKEHLLYCYENIWYKVPTFGRIFKIIDFGRAIYRFQDKIFCSDSFDTFGDAHTQYNCEPFYNPKSPRIDPNPSFDLTRLASSIYDFVIDHRKLVLPEPNEEAYNLDNFQKLICSWCRDDKDKNILYKRNGEERYPQFKLYKMIAKTVHKHTPQPQLKDALFESYVVVLVGGEELNSMIMNLDELPVYYSKK